MERVSLRAACWAALAALALVSGCATAPAGPPPSAEAVVGRWSGTVTAEGLATIAIVVVFDERLGGAMDIPSQSKTGVRLTDVEIAPPRVHFEVPIDEGKAVFEGRLSGDTISGTFTQGPLSATFSIDRAE